MPSDGAGSMAEGAGLIGWDVRLSGTDGLLSKCLAFRGLGDLPYWLLPSSGGGERARRPESSAALKDIGLDGSAVRRGLDSSFAVGMVAELVCSLSAILTAPIQFPPKNPAVAMTGGQLMVRKGGCCALRTARGLVTVVALRVAQRNTPCQLRQEFIGSVDSSCSDEEESRTEPAPQDCAKLGKWCIRSIWRRSAFVLCWTRLDRSKTWRQNHETRSGSGFEL